MINITNKFQVTLWATGAPAYANIFMGNFEQKYIFPLLKEKCLAYHVFIDGIFLIWTESKEDINEVHNSIKFERTYSKEYTCFVDYNRNLPIKHA